MVFICREFIPQLNQFAQFGWQASQLVAGQVQGPQIDQEPDVTGQTQQIVIVEIQRGQMLKLPQGWADVTHVACRER